MTMTLFNIKSDAPSGKFHSMIFCYRHKVVKKKILHKRGQKNTHRKADSIIHKWCWSNRRATCRRVQLGHYLSFCTNYSSRWIKNLNIRPDTLNLVEEKVGNRYDSLSQDRTFLDRPLVTQALRSTIIIKWDLIKQKTSVQQRTPSIW